MEAASPQQRGFPAGLCQSCGNLSVCTYFVDAREPVVFCEEYARTASEGDNELPAVESLQFLECDDSVETYKGLCSNCELRRRCSSSGLPGGVWNCEQYQ